MTIDKNNITIAGQTAPGDGICLRDYPLIISANDIVVRFIRSRLGAASGTESDAISISKGKNIILDHCSASWSVDEALSCSTGSGKPGKPSIDNITVQWSIISEALRKSNHHKGEHSYGALIRGCYGSKYSYHHNLFAHNVSRNPRPGNYNHNTRDKDPEGLLFDFRNNVMYNWRGSRPGYDADELSICRYNYVGNYAKPGSDSDTPGHTYSASCKFFRAYYSGNCFDGSIPADQWSLVNWDETWTEQEKDAYKQTAPYPTGPMETDTAYDAYKKVLDRAGASLPKRDAVDRRVINDVKNRTGKIIDDENEVGAWPKYKTYNVPKDTDRDGMDDKWEKTKGLNPNNAGDRNGYKLNNFYTNLEVYLNELAAKSKPIQSPTANSPKKNLKK